MATDDEDDAYSLVVDRISFPSQFFEEYTKFKDVLKLPCTKAVTHTAIMHH